MGDRYDVWIREVKRPEQAKVVAAAQRLLALDAAAAEALVEAAPICVRRDMDEATAKEFAEVLRKAGAFPVGVVAGTTPGFAESTEQVSADASGPGLSSAEPPTYARRAQGQPPQADTSSSQNGSSALGSLFERYKLLATTFVVAVIALGVLFAAAPTQTAVGARVAIYGGRLSDDVSVWLQEPAHQIRGVEPAVIEEWSRALRALGVRHILVVDWADDRRQTATTLMVDLKGVDAESIAEETKDRIGAAATVTFDERKLIVDFLNPN